MTNTQVNPDLEVAQQRFRKLLLLAALAFVASCVVGGVGGYLVYEANAGKSIPKFMLLLPTVAAVVVFMTPLYFVRKRWFPTKEALLEAAGVQEKNAA